MKKKTLGLDIGAPNYTNGRIYNAAIGWAVVEETINEYSDTEISNERVLRIARESLGDYLKQYREQAGLTQEVLAEKFQTTVENISDIEAGQITYTIDILFQLMNELDLFMYFAPRNGQHLNMNELKAKAK